MIWKPKYEGKDHINIYSKSNQLVGRAMSNFYKSVFVHPAYGKFCSIEGFYFWLLTGKQHHGLKSMYGFRAKSEGIKLKKVRTLNKAFKEEVVYAIGLKVVQNPHIQELLIKSELPFTHYYYYGGMYENPKIYDRSKQGDYLIDAAEIIRIKLKKNGRAIN